jgi:hypothetical protein
MTNKKAEESAKDESAIKLIYGEARNNLISGRYPLASLDDAATLGGMQLQISYGDYTPGKHAPGTGFTVYVYLYIFCEYQPVLRV